MNQRWVGWSRASGVGLGVLYVLYLIVANALLNSSFGLALANRSPGKFVASWSSGWSLYPGQARLADVRLAGHVRRTIWSVQADAVSGRVALLPLFTRELRVPTLVAEGVSGGASRIDVERLPPAPRPGGWTLRFDDIVVGDVRHAYFEDLVLQGKGKGHGGFVKTLRGGPMELLPSTLRFEAGVLFLDGTRVARDAKVDSRLAIARHRREEAPGIRKLEKADLDIALEAVTGGLRLEHDANRRPTLLATDGPGRLSGKFGWRRGSLAPGGALRLVFPATGNLDGTVQSTEAVVEARVTDDGLRLTAGVAPLSSDALSVAASFTVQGRNIPLRAPASLVQRTSGEFRGRWHFDSLAWLSDLLPQPRIIAFDGSGLALADLKIRHGELDAGSFVDVPRVAATARALGNRFDGAAHARVSFDAASRGELRPRLVAAMDDFRVAPDEAPDQPYVLGKSLHIEATASGDRSTLGDRVHARIWFADARVPDMRTYNRYLPRTNIRFLGGSGLVSGDLRFDREGAVGLGNLQVRSRQVQLALAELVLQGDIEIDTRLRRAEIKSHRFDASGSRVALKGVRVAQGEEELGADWWGNIMLDEMSLDWDKPARIDGKFRAQLRDASVLLELYGQRKRLPQWVGRIVDAGEVNAEGRVRAHDGNFLLDPFDASNDRFDVMARLRLHEKQAIGDLFARWGTLSLGVELQGGHRQVHLVGARKWFDGQPGLAQR